MLVGDEGGPVQREGPYPYSGQAPGEDPPAALQADLAGAVECAAVTGVHGVVRLKMQNMVIIAKILKKKVVGIVA